MFFYSPSPSGSRGPRSAEGDGADRTGAAGGEGWTGADGLEDLLEAVLETVRGRACAEARAAGVVWKGGLDVTREDVVRFVVGKMLTGATLGEEKALRAQFGLPALPELEDVLVSDQEAAWRAGLLKLRAIVG